MRKSLSTSPIHSAENKIKDAVSGKRVLFVATTYFEYLRVQQELNVIRNKAEYIDVIVSSNKSYFFRLLYVYTRLLFKSTKKFDLIFISFAPQLILWCWWWKFKKQNVIIDFFISFYDTLVFDRKKFKENSITAKILLRLDRFTLSKADLIIADTKQHANYFKETLGADESKLLVFYLQADETFYYGQKIAKHKSFKNKYVVFYFGTAHPLQGVDVVINAIVEVTDPSVHFIFVGPINSSQKNKLYEQKELTYYPWLAQTELAKLIAQADICLAGHFDGSINKAKRTIPGKAYIFEAMGKLIVLGENDANKERYPLCYKNILMVKMGSADALAKLINKSCQDYYNG